jgi:hypothetical protein
MPRFYQSLFVMLVACGSSQGDGAADPPNGSDGVDDAGSGGSSRIGAGGAAQDNSGGTSSQNGTGGAPTQIGTGGTGQGGKGPGSAGASGAGGKGIGGSGGGAGASGTAGTMTGGNAGSNVSDAGHTVSNCSALPAAGQWENISPVVATVGDGSGKNYSEALVADPFNAGTVWLTTGYRGIFKSTDCGATWAHVNTGRNGTQLDSGSPVSFAVDPVNKGVMYTTMIYGPGGVWKSTNSGVDWDQIVPADMNQYIPGLNFDSVAMDRNDVRHLVIGLHTNCNGPYAPACALETSDAGAAWRIVKLPTGGWEEGAGPWIVDATTWLYAGTHIWLTTDDGKNWKNLDPDPAPFWGFSGGEVETHFIPRTADGTYLLTCGQGVVKSTDGRSWSLIPSSGGRAVGFAMGGGRLFNSDQWSTTYRTASESDLTKWTTIPPSPAMVAGQGAPFIDYDAVHHVLYSSTFAGGTWRVVVP